MRQSPIEGAVAWSKGELAGRPRPTVMRKCYPLELKKTLASVRLCSTKWLKMPANARVYAFYALAISRMRLNSYAFKCVYATVSKVSSMPCSRALFSMKPTM